MSVRDVSLAIAVVLAAACVRHTGVAGGQLRGVGAGWQTEPAVRSAALTQLGEQVVIVAAPDAGCTHVGYVTGVAKQLHPRPVGQSREQWESSLPWRDAENDARNLAAAHGAKELVIDARETQEHRSEYEGSIAFRTYLLVHSRAFTCRGR